MVWARKRKQPPPEWAQNAPPRMPGDEFFLGAFWQLSTERFQGSQIPWSKVDEHGRRLGMTGWRLDLFHRLIETLDEAYLGWVTERQQKRLGTDRFQGARQRIKERGLGHTR